MSCPDIENLNRWVDGTLDEREAAVVRRHAAACAGCRGQADGLRRAVEALENLAEPGPNCLDAEAMATLLDGGAVPPHVKGCPRCAAELKALRPAYTARVVRPRVPWMSWAAAAGVLLAAGLLAWVLLRPSGDGEIYVRVPEIRRIPPPPPPPPPPEEPDPVAPPTTPIVEPPKDFPLPPRETPPPAPPVPPVPAPDPAPPASAKPPEPPAPAPSPTVAEAPRTLAVQVRSGHLQVHDGVKDRWVRTQRIEEGSILRAEGRTQMQFAHARFTLEGNARFQLAKDELALVEGSFSAEFAAGSACAIVLGGERLQPEASVSRVLLCARPDRVVIEEGTARWRDQLLPEGVEYQLRRGRFEPQRRRSLPGAARPKESLGWKMDLSNPAVVRKQVSNGRVESMPEGRLLVSAPIPGNLHFSGQAQYYNGGEEKPLFTVKAGTHLRIRYFLTEDAPLELVLWNRTKGENFNKRLLGIPRQWSTVTIALKDIPPNRGGKPAPAEAGDEYSSVGLFVGKPGQNVDVYLDRIEVLEIEP
jgi:hypothetical protein